MKSVWSKKALSDLAYAVVWINDYDPDGALRLDETVESFAQRLEQYPFSGNIGRVAGTREAVIGNYILIYAVCENMIKILRFIHKG